MVTKRKMSAWTGWTTAFVIDQLYNMQFFCISCKSVSQGRAQDISLGARPKGRAPRAGVGFPGGAATPSTPARGSGERCELPSGVRGAEPRPPKGFPLFSALRMASRDTI